MSRKRGKDKRAAKQAVPEEILAEGSGPNEVVEANAQSLADAASDALGPVADVEVRADAGDEPAPRKRGKKTRATTDAWGQPIEVPEDELIEASPADGAVEAVEAGEQDMAADAAEPAAPTSRGKKGKRKAKASSRSETAEEQSVSVDAPVDAEMSASDEASDEAVEQSLESAGDDEPTDAALDAEPGELTAEAQSEQALEDAVMRAEAEAELGEGEEPAEGDDVEIEGVVGAALPTTAASMDAAQLKNLVEALVFAADKPVTLLRLRQLTRVSEVKRLEDALAEIAADYRDRGIALQQVSGGYQFRTNTQYSVWVQQLIAGRPVRLSRAQLETLAIVAYRQPITRPEVDEIRGVDSSATLRLLLDRSLIRVLGKKEDVGRPTLYGTTKEFLDFFSLSDLRELPTLREYSELTAESRKVMSDRLGIDADGNPVDEEGEAEGEVAAAVDAAAGNVAAAAVSAPELDVEAQLAADDAAAVEAVSAVTGDVVGIVDADAGLMEATAELGDESVRDSLSSDESMYAADEPHSSDAHVGADAESMSAAADNVEPSADPESTNADVADADLTTDDVVSMSADASTDEPHSSDAVDADVESMSAAADNVESISADPEPTNVDVADAESTTDEVASMSADAESMSTGAAADVESTSAAADDVESMSAVAATGDAQHIDAHVGADVESMSAAADDVEPISADAADAESTTDDVASMSADAESMSTGAADDAESMSAAADDVEPISADASTDEAHRSAAHVGADISPMSTGAADDAESTSQHKDDDKGAMFASTSKQELGAPRGSSQDDVIAIAHDAAHDPDELGTDEPHDLAAADRHVPDDLQPTGGDAGIAGAAVLEDGEADIEASGTPNPEVIDASAPDSLDETDEPPAD